MPRAESPFHIELLGGSHDRVSFSCGVAALDRYLHTQVSQDIKRRLAACYVATVPGGREVIGYYTISAASIPLPELAPSIIKKLPRYPTVPCVRVGRLAIASHMHGKGIGSLLLADAVHRALAADIAAFAMIVDAKDDRASSFYRHHGFIQYESRPLSLYLPLEAARKVLGLV